MTFKSKKDWLNILIMLSIIVLIIGIVCNRIYLGNLKPHDYWGLAITLLVVGLLLWLFFGTNYELKNDKFIYRNGPISGKIDIDRIREIEKGKTLWVGYRPATARGGLIIKYDKFNELHISPETNDTFIDAILLIKRDIKIVANT